MLKLERVVAQASVSYKKSLDKNISEVEKQNKLIEKTNLSDLRDADRRNKLISKENENIKKLNDEIDKQVKLRSGLTSATSIPAVSKQLSKVISDKQGGEATDEIKKRLAQAETFRKQFSRNQKQLQDVKTKLRNLSIQKSIEKKGSSAWWKIHSKEIPLQGKRRRLRASMRSSIVARGASLARGKQAALGSRSRLGNIGTKQTAKPFVTASQTLAKTVPSLTMLAKVLPGINIAFGTTIGVVQKFQSSISESTEIVQKYSRFSMGALHAAVMMQVRDIQRNIYSSRQLSNSMLKFAEASSDAKDKWANTNIILDKFTLAMGTLASNVSGWFGEKVAGPLASTFDHVMARLNDFGGATEHVINSLGPFAIALKSIAKAVDWKAQDEQDQLSKHREMVARRRAFFAGDQNVQMQKGDVNPLERQMLSLTNKQAMDRMPAADQPGQPMIPGQPVKPGQLPNAPPNPPVPARDVGGSDPISDMFKNIFNSAGWNNAGQLKLDNNQLKQAANGNDMTPIQPGRGWNRNIDPVPAGLIA